MAPLRARCRHCDNRGRVALTPSHGTRLVYLTVHSAFKLGPQRQMASDEAVARCSALPGRPQPAVKLHSPHLRHSTCPRCRCCCHRLPRPARARARRAPPPNTAPTRVAVAAAVACRGPHAHLRCLHPIPMQHLPALPLLPLFAAARTRTCVACTPAQCSTYQRCRCCCCCSLRPARARAWSSR